MAGPSNDSDERGNKSRRSSVSVGDSVLEHLARRDGQQRNERSESRRSSVSIADSLLEYLRKRDREASTNQPTDGDDASVEKLDSKVVDVEEDDPLRHLPPREREVIERQLAVPTVKVTFWSLFRYASKKDLFIIFISGICAIIGGAAQPLMTVGSDDTIAGSSNSKLTILSVL
jgi:hypothetical protein